MIRALGCCLGLPAGPPFRLGKPALEPRAGCPVVVSGCRSGTVQICRLTEGATAGDPLTGHRGEVRAVAVGRLPNRTPVIISGGGDSKMRAAVRLRMSTGHQEAGNQVPDVERFAGHHGHELVARYEVSESAWNGGKDGGDYRSTLRQALDDAHAGKFSVLVVWALDRVTREGAEDALRIIRQFRERGCTVVSVKESWFDGSPEVQDVFVAFAGWMAQQESARRSERIRAGLERRRAEGKPVGRQPDKRIRKRSGYVAAWEEGGKHRAAK